MSRTAELHKSYKGYDIDITVNQILVNNIDVSEKYIGRVYNRYEIYYEIKSVIDANVIEERLEYYKQRA